MLVDARIELVRFIAGAEICCVVVSGSCLRGGETGIVAHVRRRKKVQEGQGSGIDRRDRIVRIRLTREWIQEPTWSKLLAEIPLQHQRGWDQILNRGLPRKAESLIGSKEKRLVMAVV